MLWDICSILKHILTKKNKKKTIWRKYNTKQLLLCKMKKKTCISVSLHLINTQGASTTLQQRSCVNERPHIWLCMWTCIYTYTFCARSRAPGWCTQSAVWGKEEGWDEGLDIQKVSGFPAWGADSRYRNPSEWLYTLLSTPQPPLGSAAVGRLSDTKYNTTAENYVSHTSLLNKCGSNNTTQ